MSRHAPHFGLFTLRADGSYEPASLATIIAVAKEGLDASFAREVTMNAPQVVKDYLALKLGAQEREVFAAIFLDSQHQALEYRELFFGTLTQTSVHPREIVKAALLLNAGAVIVAHNHPSGIPEPSRADEVLTQTLKATLATVDVKLLDHFVIGAGKAVSFAERGLL
jgi:DNA repair protein RadC